jgi:hypothetical protein
MSKLEPIIERAALGFAQTIIAAVKGATLQELLAMQDVAVAAPTQKRGRPPKAKPGRKRGRPPKTEKHNAVLKPKTAAIRTKKQKRAINWPKCKHPGCKKNRWARGEGYCGKHFKVVPEKPQTPRVD